MPTIWGLGQSFGVTLRATQLLYSAISVQISRKLMSYRLDGLVITARIQKAI